MIHRHLLDRASLRFAVRAAASLADDPRASRRWLAHVDRLARATGRPVPVVEPLPDLDDLPDDL